MKEGLQKALSNLITTVTGEDFDFSQLDERVRRIHLKEPMIQSSEHRGKVASGHTILEPEPDLPDYSSL